MPEDKDAKGGRLCLPLKALGGHWELRPKDRGWNMQGAESEKKKERKTNHPKAGRRIPGLIAAGGGVLHKDGYSRRE